MSDYAVLFCQNDFHMEGSFWQKDSLTTHILFELCLFMIFSPVANLMHHPLPRENACKCKGNLAINSNRNTIGKCSVVKSIKNIFRDLLKRRKVQTEM